jgi:cytochrome c oxidase subunit 3
VAADTEAKAGELSRLKTGMVMFIVSEVFLFGALFFTYYYLRATTTGWPPHHPAATRAIANTVVLLSSSLTMWLAGRSIRLGRVRALTGWLIVTVALGLAFLGVTGWEWASESFQPWTDAYGSIFFTLTGFHALHVLGGVLLLTGLSIRSARGRFSALSHHAVEVSSLYWHYVDIIWLLVLTTVFIIR